MRRFSTRLLAVILVLTVVISSVSLAGMQQVNAISVSDDLVKLMEAANNLTNANRVAIVDLIADESQGYALREDYNANLQDNAEEIYAILDTDGISLSAVERGLEEFKDFYDASSTNKTLVKYALGMVVEGLTHYDDTEDFNGIKNNIEHYTITFDIFMNFMDNIVTLTGKKPLKANAEKTSLQYNPELGAYIELALAILDDVDEARLNAYVNKIKSLIEVVNNYDATERDNFIEYLIAQDLVIVESSDNSGGSGGSGGGGSTPAEPVTTVKETTITSKPVLDTATGTATTAISQTTINSAVNNIAPGNASVGEVTLQIPAVPGASSYAVGLPAAAVSASALNYNIEIVTQVASVQIPSNMLTGTAGSNVQLVVAKANTTQLPTALQAQIGNRPVIDLSMKVDGTRINWSNPDAPVTVSIPYTPTAAELQNPENIVVWYIDGANNPVAVPSGRYNPATGMVTFEVEHFSYYAVVYSKKTFSDLGKHEWARKQIEVLAAKGIVRGTMADKFEPAANITRADYLEALINALGLTAKIDSNFSDISTMAPYSQEIAVAKKLGITTGIGNNKFAPETPITRQDMMVLTAKALNVAKKLSLTDSTTELGGFADQNGIAAYARASVAAMVRSGVIVGDGKNINPKANTSRAEASVIMYRIYNGIE